MTELSEIGVVAEGAAHTSSCGNCDAPCGGCATPMPEETPAHRRIVGVRAGHVGRGFVRPMQLNAGGVHDGQGHAHDVPHLTRIERGSRVRVDWRNPRTGASGSDEFEGPCYIWIEAEVHHCFTPLTDRAEWDCIFIRPPDSEPQPIGVFHQERPADV